MRLQAHLAGAPGRAVAIAATCSSLLLAAACSTPPYDASQRPTVTVTVAASVTISWEPAGAQDVRVYRGTTAGDSYTPDLMWSVESVSENSITSGFLYGVMPSGARTNVPATALVPGQAYTVRITREVSSGDGFTSNRRRYVGTASFVAP